MNGPRRSRDLDLSIPSDSVRTRRIPRLRSIVIAWLSVAAWAAIIWRLGGDDFSAANTSSMLFEWLRIVIEQVDPRTRYRILIAVRKSAHFIEYAVLALLTFRAAMVSGLRNQFTTAAWIALFLVATLASADEARQAFSQTRTGSPYDVLLDVLGGAVAILGLLLISRRIRIDTAVANEIGPR